MAKITIETNNEALEKVLGSIKRTALDYDPNVEVNYILDEEPKEPKEKFLKKHKQKLMGLIDNFFKQDSCSQSWKADSYYMSFTSYIPIKLFEKYEAEISIELDFHDEECRVNLLYSKELPETSLDNLILNYISEEIQDMFENIHESISLEIISPEIKTFYENSCSFLSKFSKMMVDFQDEYYDWRYNIQDEAYDFVKLYIKENAL